MTAPTVRYERNSAGLGELLMSQGMGDHVARVAEAGLVFGQTIAPRLKNTYADTLVVARGADAFPSPRRVASIVATVPYAQKVEERHGTLGKIADTIEANA